MRAASISLVFFAFALSGCSRSEDQADDRQNREQAEILLVGDPFAYALEQLSPELDQAFGAAIVLNVERYLDTLRNILQNSRDVDSFYNLVSFDNLWLPELVREEALSPLSSQDLETIGVERSDFFPQTMGLCEFNGQLYGLPIQPHFELLFYRRDWLEEAGLQPPETLDELLEQARRFHDPVEGVYGVCWNGLRGAAFSQTITHLYAAMGEPVIDSEGKARIDTATGVKVLRFLKNLIEVSPPDILTMAWDERIRRFKNGRAAFTYGWGARSYSLESNPSSKVSGQVGYAIPPNATGSGARTPFGQWIFGLPANLTPEKRAQSLELLEVLMSPATNEKFGSIGFENLHRISAVPDAGLSEYQKTCRVIFEEDLISPGARPDSEQWSAISVILGTTLHDALLGRTAIKKALQLAQEQADAITKEPAP